LTQALPAVAILAVLPGDLLFPHALGRLHAAGIPGCIDHGCGEEMLLDTLAAVCSGEQRYGVMPSKLLHHFRSVQTDNGKPAKRSLSKREMAVAELITGGMSSKVIAGELGIRESTVQVFRRRLYKKAGVGSAVDLVRWMQAMEVGND
jgi:DNA-binding NarL/FixJ family response regulator